MGGEGILPKLGLWAECAPLACVPFVDVFSDSVNRIFYLTGCQVALAPSKGMTGEGVASFSSHAIRKITPQARMYLIFTGLICIYSFNSPPLRNILYAVSASVPSEALFIASVNGSPLRLKANILSSVHP